MYRVTFIDADGQATELTAQIESLSDAGTPENIQAALDALHALSVRSGQLSERLGYRFAAGQAYGDVLRRRLANLRENSTPRGSTLTHYIGNRVDPGLATCAAMVGYGLEEVRFNFEEPNSFREND